MMNIKIVEAVTSREQPLLTSKKCGVVPCGEYTITHMAHGDNIRWGKLSNGGWVSLSGRAVKKA